MKVVLRQFQRFYNDFRANRLRGRMANGVTKTTLLNAMKDLQYILEICQEVAPLSDKDGVCIDDDEPIHENWLCVKNCLSIQWPYITRRAKKLKKTEERPRLDGAKGMAVEDP